MAARRILSWRLGGCRRLHSSSMAKGDGVRIGCSSGFWGDTSVSAPQLVHHGNINYLVSDYLSEITMSLLTATKRKSPSMGYTPDFVQSLRPLLKDIKKKGIRVVSNAGGVNPQACATALREMAKEQGVELSVAVVTGDDLIEKMDDVRGLGARDIDSGIPLPPSVVSMNAYLGAFPIAEALGLGADVVVTGRCVDSALALAPLIHEYGWHSSDFDLLAAGSLAGHLIECGAQATGGIFTDWDKVEGWERMGFPVVECGREGQVVLTKPPNTGGLVSWATVAEQLVYEIGDPRAYILPDVTVDMSQVVLTEMEGYDGGAVSITGVRGTPPTSDYKVSATYGDGYRVISLSPVVGPRAGDKARKTAEAILARMRGLFKQLGMEDYTETCIHVLGSEQSYGHPSVDAREAVLWLGVKHRDKKALELHSQEIAPAGTGMAPGLTTLVGGRPNVSPVLRLFSFFCPKDRLPVSIYLNGELVKTMVCEPPAPPVQTPTTATVPQTDVDLLSGNHSYRLGELAYLRSGDKGDTANIGVIARHPSILPYLRRSLTVEAVGAYFSHFMASDSFIERYDLPGIGALNFVMKHSLGGGGVASIRVDPQGKAYGQMLADLEIPNLPSLGDLGLHS